MPASQNPIDLSSVIFEKGREHFRLKKFAAAAQSFQELIDKYPSSSKLVDAYFLKAESLFLSAQYPQCIDTIDFMVSQFPESELTGFIMLRLGQIFVSRNRTTEAIELYKVVNQRFPANLALKDQAAQLIKSTENQ